MSSKIRFMICIVLSLVLSAPNALAITGKDVMEKMSVPERSSYLFGLVDMLSYTALLEGNKDRANCIYEQYYQTRTMPENVLAALLRYPDKAPEGIVIVLMKKACGQ